MSVECIASDFQFRLVEMDLWTVTAYETVTALVSNQKPDVVADDRARGRHTPDGKGREAVVLARGDSGCDQGGLAGKRDAEAFDADEQEHSDVSVARHEVVDVHWAAQ